MVHQHLGEALAEFTAETGIALEGFTELLLFGDMESEGYLGGYIGFIVIGPVDVVSALEEEVAGEAGTTTYGGQTVYTDETGEWGVCFLSSTMVVAGSMDAVKGVIDVKNGAAKLGGQMLECYSALGDVWMKAVVEVSEEWLSEIPDEMGEMSLSPFQDIEMVGFGFDKSGEGDASTITSELRLYFSSEESAQEAQELINLVVTFIGYGGMPDMPPEIVDLIDNIGVSRSSNWLTITFQITVGEIEEMMEPIGQGG